MNYKMMGKFLSQILIVEAGFMVPALLISLYTASLAAVYGFGLSILITAGVGALMYYFCRNSTRRFFCEGRDGLRSRKLDCNQFFRVSAICFFPGKFQTLSMLCLKLYRDLQPQVLRFWEMWKHFLPELCTGGVSATGWAAWGYLYFFWHFLRTEREAKRVYHASAACGESGIECEQAGAENAYNSKNFVCHIHGADIHQFPVSPVGKNAGF